VLLAVMLPLLWVGSRRPAADLDLERRFDPVSAV
jgi:hypothetical protein